MQQSTERFWNDIAEKYARKPVPNPDAYQAKLRVLRALLSPEHTVLDVGCGTGSLALELAPHVRHVHAVDISREMLRIAQDKAAAGGVANVSFHHAPASGLPAFEDGSFDVVCAFNILHLIDDRRGLLARLSALLVPGGRFVSTTPCLGEGWVPYGVILPVLRLLGKAPPVEVFRVAALEAELRAVGLVELERPEVGADQGTAFVIARKPG